MAEYKSVAGFVQDDLDVIFVASEEDLEAEQMLALAARQGHLVSGNTGWWVMRHGKPGTGVNGAVKNIASHPHWLTLESGESEEKERK